MPRNLGGLAFALAVGLPAAAFPQAKTVVRLAELRPARQDQAQRAALQALADEVRTALPKVSLELDLEDVALYETIGLPTLLARESAPDIFLEWGGNRLRSLVDHGLAADLTFVLDARLRERYPSWAWAATTVGGKCYMLPFRANVSVLTWYNRGLFARYGLRPPTTWEEFLALCDAFKGKGITPIAIGNRDLWVAGNWMGHLVSRVAGEEAYAGVIEGRRPARQADVLAAFERIADFGRRGYLHPGFLRQTPPEAFAAWREGRTAMLISGSWNLTATTEAGMDVDFFNLPPVPGGRGVQTSVMRSVMGFVVHPRTPHPADTIAVLRVLAAAPVGRMLAKSGVSLARRDADLARDVPPLARKLRDLLDTAPTQVSSPDTGFPLSHADAFNMAVTEVLGGMSTPEEALARFDARLAQARPSQRAPRP